PVDRALIGHAAILSYLHDHGIRRRNGGPLTWRIVLQWRRDHGCPIVRGNRQARYASPALSTTAHLGGWLLSRFHTGALYRVAIPQPMDHRGTFLALAKRKRHKALRVSQASSSQPAS